MSYSSQKVSPKLLDEIKDALQGVLYGSIEIIIQGGVVTQITKRNIKKTSLRLQEQSSENTIEENAKNNPLGKKKISVKKILLDN